MEKRRILFVIESLTGGGAEKILSILIKNIDKEKFHTSVCSVVDKGVYKADIKANAQYSYVLPDAACWSPGFRKYLYPFLYKAVYNWLPARLIMSYIEKDNYDVIIAFTEGFPTKLVAASAQKKAKKIAWIHIDLLNNPWTQNVGIFKSIKEERDAYNNFNQIIGVSENVTEAFQKVYNPKTSAKVLYNPIDNIDIINKSVSNEIHKAKSENIINMVTVGRLESQKGYDRLIYVLGDLKNDGYSFFLRIVGEGSERKRLEELIAEYNLGNEIRLIGFKENPYPYIKEADLFVCSSRSEGYSTVVTESLIIGTPVLTTECSGMKELLTNERSGKIVPNTTQGIYEGLKEIFNNHEIISEYKENIKSESHRFNISNLLLPIENLLNT